MSLLFWSIGAAVAAVVLYRGFVWSPAPSRALDLDDDELRRPFPEGFLWGSGEDAYQHEGGNTNNDWHAWIHREPSPIKGGAKHGRGTNFWELYADDFARAAADHHGAHRIGLEWSRIEPERGRYDEEALGRYVDMVRAMKERHGFTTFVNVWHFTLPTWAAQTGGWEDDALLARFEALVEKVGRALGPWVDHWSTMIDAQSYALGGYFSGEIPPQQRNARRAVAVYQRLIEAHATAYRVLHAVDVVDREGRPKQASVGQIYFFLDFTTRGVLIDPVVRAVTEKTFNRSMLDTLQTGELDLWLPPARRIRLTMPEAKQTLDWIGVNYFTRAVLSVNPLHPGLVSRARQSRNPHTDMDWEIFPEGLHRVLTGVAARHPGVPLYVSECGLSDPQDALRGRFILDHVAWARRAVQEGVPLKGFFYWSMTDNWEWALGDAPRFGLYGVDYATAERKRRRSADVFAFLARENRLPTGAERERLLAGGQGPASGVAVPVAAGAAHVNG